MNRTVNAIRNVRVAILFYVLEMLLGFISRKVFIDFIGANVLGLNTIAYNILQFLNLAELGIGSAVAFTLYAPLAHNDKQAVTEIIRVQGWLYRRVAYFVIAGSAVVMCFFPFFFAKSDLPLWYAYATFLVFLYTALLTYFFNYKQIALSAAQKEYKITLAYKSFMLLKSVAQILAMWKLPNGYVWWLIIQVVFSTLATISLSHTIRKEFPFLSHLSLKIDRKLREKYKIIITKTKQLFVHKIANYTLSQTSSLIIYGYTTLTLVAIYGNYMLIVMAIISLMQAMFNGITAGVGNLIASHDNERIWSIFKELFTSRFFITTTCCFVLYYFMDSFIVLWVGENMLLDDATLIVIIINCYIMCMRPVVDSFISGYGLFADIWAPITEAILNISLSILLGKFFGITGVLLGVTISLILIVCTWKPIYLFRWAMHRPIMHYVRLYAVHVVALIATWLVVAPFATYILKPPTNYFMWAINAIASMGLFAIIECIILAVITREMRQFLTRMYNLVVKKL